MIMPPCTPSVSRRRCVLLSRSKNIRGTRFAGDDLAGSVAIRLMPSSATVSRICAVRLAAGVTV